MRTCRYVAMMTILAAGVLSTTVLAQAVPPGASGDQPETIPLDVQVVISRYQGDKLVSRLPYSLAVNTGSRDITRLRMGSEVAVSQFVPPLVDDDTKAPVFPGGGPIQYKDIGTNIDVTALGTEGNAYRLSVSVAETSVYLGDERAEQVPVKGAPVFRTFSSSNTVLLRDGQTREFTTATDRVSGEVVRISVTLRVVK